MSQQNKVEQALAGLPYQVDGLGLPHKSAALNDAGFPVFNQTTSSSNIKIQFHPQETGGVKHDNGKPDLSHISLTLVEEVARVREFGAKKYSRGNWLKGFKYTRSIAAALRHIFAFSSGEDLDQESGLSHISHAVCCLEHLLNDIKNHPQNDDRK